MSDRDDRPPHQPGTQGYYRRPEYRLDAIERVLALLLDVDFDDPKRAERVRILREGLAFAVAMKTSEEEIENGMQFLRQARLVLTWLWRTAVAALITGVVGWMLLKAGIK